MVGWCRVGGSWQWVTLRIERRRYAGSFWSSREEPHAAARGKDVFAPNGRMALRHIV